MQQNKTADEMSDFMVDTLVSFFGEKICDFVSFNIGEKPYKTFSVRFKAYNYFIVLLNYDRGILGCNIQFGEYGIGLPNSQKWFDKADFQVFCEELKRELELRIPDKFLRAHGWLK